MSVSFIKDWWARKSRPSEQSTFFTRTAAQPMWQWTGAQAFLCLLTAAASADGHTSPEENEEILTALHRQQLFRSVSREEIRSISDAVADRLKMSRETAIAEACKELPDSLRLACFATAVEIVLADGETVELERDFLDDLMGGLMVGEDQAAKILEVLEWKNSY